MLGEDYKPNKDGVLVCFSCDHVANDMSRVADAGGKVVLDKKANF